MEKGTKKKALNIVLFMAACGASIFVALFVYAKNGIPGHIIDLIYSLERIEGLKDAISHGDLFASVYPRFYGGYGYGTPMFYSDVFFLPAALLRIVGFSATQSFKLFVALIVAAHFFTSYISYKKMSGDRFIGLTGAVITVTSVYFIWEIVYRAGISSYIASMFFPVLSYALWDFFFGGKEEKCGTKTYLFTIAFLGMALSHVMSAATALVFTVLTVLISLLFKRTRKIVFSLTSIKRIVSYAVLTLGLSAFYIVPMIEQMMSGRFYYEKPLVNIGDYVVSFSSLFGVRAYTDGYDSFIGLGAALLVGILTVAILSVKNKKFGAAAVITLLGVLLSVTITDIFPWHIFNNTPVNGLQFSFRLFPVAICLIVTGFVLTLCKEAGRTKIALLTVVSLLSLVFAVVENKDVKASELSLSFGDEFLDTEGTYYVGMGTEWLPLEADISSFNVTDVVSDGESFSFARDGYNRYSFEDINGGHDAYTCPLIFYKGYKASITTEDGTVKDLSVVRGNTGLVKIENPGKIAGIVTVSYKKTAMKVVSIAVSFVFLAAFMICILKKKKES